MCVILLIVTSATSIYINILIAVANKTLLFNPSKAGPFEGIFSCGSQLDPFIFQEELI